MSIQAICPDCSKEYTVSEERVGTKFRCKVCKAVIAVEELEESPLIQGRKQKVLQAQQQAANRSKKFKQNVTQVVMVLIGVAALLGVGVAAVLFPAVAETLGQILTIGGLVGFGIAWLVIMMSEENIMLRLLMRFFPPAILISIVTRLDEVWPWALLGVGGAIAAISGQVIQGGI